MLLGSGAELSKRNGDTQLCKKANAITILEMAFQAEWRVWVDTRRSSLGGVNPRCVSPVFANLVCDSGMGTLNFASESSTLGTKQYPGDSAVLLGMGSRNGV